MAYSVTISATGVTKIATGRQGTGPGGWYLVITANTNTNGTAWNGSLVLAKNATAPGTATIPPAAGSLTNVAYYDSNGAAVNAGTAITATTTVTVDDTNYDLYLNHTLTTAGTSVTVTVSEAAQLAAEPLEGVLPADNPTYTGTLTGSAATITTVTGSLVGAATSVGHALTGGSYLTSGGTFDGAAARTFAVDATSANTVSKVVARDGSGNFSAGTITAALTGAASTNTTQGNALRAYLADGMLAIATITVSGGDATKFKTTTTAIYTISGAAYTKAATDTLAFSSAGTINVLGAGTTAHWGVWLVQINAAGTISTKAPGGGTTDQDYSTEALAIAALPAVDASNCQLGYITVQGLASTSWAATTSNLTVGGGVGNCTARTFYDLPAAKALPAAI